MDRGCIRRIDFAVAVVEVVCIEKQAVAEVVVGIVEGSFHFEAGVVALSSRLESGFPLRASRPPNNLPCLVLNGEVVLSAERINQSINHSIN